MGQKRFYMGIAYEMDLLSPADVFGKETRLFILGIFCERRSPMRYAEKWELIVELGTCSMFLMLWLAGILITWTGLKLIAAVLL